MAGKVRLFPEYEAVDTMVFVFIDEFFNQRFGFGKTIVELTSILRSYCSVEILAKEQDFGVLRPMLAEQGIADSDYVWTPNAPPMASVELMFAHSEEGQVVGITYDYLHDHELYESVFRECEQYAIEFLQRRGIPRIVMPFDFVAARVAANDSVVLVSDYHGPETLRWLEEHVSQECVAVPYLRTEHSRDLDVFVLPIADDTWMLTQFGDAREERQTVDTVIGILQELNQEVVLVPGLELIVHDDVNCLPNYANSVLANGAALVPEYGRPEDEVALRVLSGAGYQTFGVRANTVVESNYVFHCMSTAVPRVRDSGASMA